MHLHLNLLWRENQFLFKRFADIDSIDIEINSVDTNSIIETIKNISGTFGGINLEDIAAPECFIIEQTETSVRYPNFSR